MTSPIPRDPAHQAVAAWPPTAEEQALGDALEAILKQGIHDLDGIVDGLNRSGVAAPGGGAWTVESFQAEMRRLGA
jgi:hypothetical protein